MEMKKNGYRAVGMFLNKETRIPLIVAIARSEVEAEKECAATFLDKFHPVFCAGVILIASR